jgi:hypothetical protein
MASHWKGEWKKGGRVKVGPFWLRLTAEPTDPINSYWIAMRDDGLWKLRMWLHQATFLPDLVYRRLILTAAVWKLASPLPGIQPSYHDLHLYKKIRKWLRR